MMMHEVGLPLREPSGEGSDLSTVEMRSFATAAGGALVAWSPARPVRTPALQSSREEENLHHKHKKREIQHLSCHSVTGINSRGNRHFITSRFQSDVDCRRVNRPTAEYSPGLSTAALVRSQMEVPKTQLKSSACASPEAHVVRRIVQIGAETHDLLGKLDQPTDYGTKLVEAASTDLRCSVPKIHGTGASGRPVPNIVKIAELETCLSEGGSQVFQTEFIHGKIRFLLPPHQPLRTSYAAVHQPHAVLLTNRTTDTMHTTAIRNTKVVSCLAKMSLAQQTTSPINHKHVLPWTADGISKRVRVGLDDRRLTRAVDDQRSNHLIREELPNLNPRNKECVDISVAIEANTHVQAAAKIRITSKPNPRMILNSKFLAPLRSLLLFHHYQRHSKKRMRNAAGQYGSTPASEIPETPTSCTGQWAEVYQSSPEPLNHGHMPLQAPCFLDGTHLNAATALNSQRVSETVFKIEEAEDRAGSKSRKEKLEVLLRLVEGNYEAYQANVLEMRNNFDQFGGQDGSLLYTALGLQAMSRRFRTCKDGIVRQLRIATRETNLSSQLRQARGKVHPERQPLKPNPRGPDLHARLPDSATLILRRWLFEHFLKPYPQHRDKCWLAERTALSRAQVTNWFINARVRLWKPMVEELYGQIQSEDEAGQAAQESSINSGQSSQDGTNNSGSHHTVERDFMLLAGPVRGTRSSA